ncbi:MAG: septum formation protein Maf [Bacteroides sp.]|nr:septum formation protein Maf [Bacteroides sp.]
MLDNLHKYKILLASKSPRRRELLEQLRVPFSTVTIRGIDESYPEDMRPIEVPEYLANYKADAYKRVLKSNELIITADTLVINDDKIFGKPESTEKAVETLMELSGKTHLVVTGVCVLTASTRRSFSTVTEVRFAKITREEAEYYVSNFHPLDKAGAYGIQEWIGCVAVESINGSFYNVMGLPVHQLYQTLKEF